MTDKQKTIVSCPSCGKRYYITITYAGQDLPCPECKSIVSIPNENSFRKEDYSGSLRSSRGSRSGSENQHREDRGQRGQRGHVTEAQAAGRERYVSPDKETETKKPLLKKPAIYIIILLLAAGSFLAYHYRDTFRQWYLRPESSTAAQKIIIPDLPEKELAEKLIQELDLTSEEKKQIQKLQASYIREGLPQAPPWPVVSKDQQRWIHDETRIRRHMIDAEFKKHKNDEQEVYRKILRENKLHYFLSAYHWNKQEKYLKHWMKCTLHYLLQELARVHAAEAQRGRNRKSQVQSTEKRIASPDNTDKTDPCIAPDVHAMVHSPLITIIRNISYIDKLNFEKYPGLNGVVAYACKVLGRRAQNMRTKADAMNILYASHFLGNTETGRSIRNKALAVLRNKQIPDGPLPERVSAWPNLIAYLILQNPQRGQRGHVTEAHRGHEPEARRDRVVSPDKVTKMENGTRPLTSDNGNETFLLTLAERLTQEMAILLEPDGCMPQISGITRRINMREAVYWASRLFNRDDFRFIAYGGMRMPDAYPPCVRSVFFENRNLCVMRSTWNICLYTNEVNDKWLGPDAASLTIDLETGEISVFGNNHPQFIMHHENYGKLIPSRTEWKAESDYNYLAFETDTHTTRIYFFRKARSWIIRTAYKNSKKPGKTHVYLYRSHAEKKNPSRLESVHFQRFTMYRDSGLLIKQPGCFTLAGSSEIAEPEKTGPSIEGCYIKTDIAAARKRELIITANPLLPNYGSRYDYRDFVFYNIKKKENSDNEYTVYTYKMEYKKPINRNSKPVPTEPEPYRTIRVSDGKIEPVKENPTPLAQARTP